MDLKKFKELAPDKGIMLYCDVDKKDQDGNLKIIGAVSEMSLEDLGYSFLSVLIKEPIDNQILLFEMILNFLKKKQEEENG